MSWRILILIASITSHAHAGELYAFKLRQDLSPAEVTQALTDIDEVATQFGTGAVTLHDPKLVGVIELSAEGADALRQVTGVRTVERNDPHYINSDSSEEAPADAGAFSYTFTVSSKLPEQTLEALLATARELANGAVNYSHSARVGTADLTPAAAESLMRVEGVTSVREIHLQSSAPTAPECKPELSKTLRRVLGRLRLAQHRGRR